MCRPCLDKKAINTDMWRKKVGREHVRLKEREYFKNNQSVIITYNRFLNLWKRFKMSEDEYLWRLQEQHFACYTCKKPFNRENNEKEVQVDHNHETGKVRGLVCISCNLALGQIQDSINLLASMITYLISDGKGPWRGDDLF